MKKIDKDRFLERSAAVLEQMAARLQELKPVSMESFRPDRSALIILDMVNGFIREGALQSDRMEDIVKPTVELLEKCSRQNIPIVAFADCHSEAATEFESYPPHCVRGTREAEVIREIAGEGRYTLIPKNSTNGFLEDSFKNWLSEHGETTDFILAGDCTDICVMQFALTLKAYFNSRDIKARLVVPVNAVETYDLGEHYGDLMNVMALQIMNWNGIEPVSGII